MGARDVIVAVDLGTSGVKVALVDSAGGVLGWESRPVALRVTPDGGAEQSPAEWWSAFVDATKAAVAKAGVGTSSVAALCCSTQGEGTVPVDRDGNALSDCVLWMDMRGAAALKRRFKGLVNVSGASLGRLVRWITLTGGMPSMTGKDPAGHMLFIRDEWPEIYEKTYKFLNVLDYMNLRLTGRFVATHDSILTSWVTDNRDPRRIAYHKALVRDSGIDADKFPELVACADVVGTLSAQAAGELGLSREVRVVAGAIDNTAAAIGSGAVADYAAHLYLGTSSWMGVHVPFKKTDIGSALASVPCALPDRYLLTALQATAGGNLSFLRDKILYHKDELLAEAAVPDVFKIMDDMAARTPAGSNGVMYFPWIWGERAPVEDRRLRASLFNLSLDNDRADVVRAFLEGIAYNTRWMLGPVERFTGRKTGLIRVAGGGGVSDVWCSIFADVLDRPVGQIDDSIRANARGAAFIARVGLGELSFADVPALVPVKRVWEPDPRTRTLHDERFGVFAEYYKKTKKLYAKLNA